MDKQKTGLVLFNNSKNIMHRFPNKLYSNSFNIPNLIDNADYYVLKPKGIKSYLWFTYYKKDLLCLLIFMNKHSNIMDETNEFYYYNINYDKRLCYNNVLLNGTYFYKIIKKTVKHYFILDNVLNYNYFNLDKFTINEHNDFTYKLNLYKLILPFLINTNYKIYLGIILDNYSAIFKHIYKLDYKLYSIACYNKKKYLGNFIVSNSSNNLEKPAPANFRVYACINQDIYKLYVLENNKEVFYDYALIDSYKTSVFMNNLFRTIKENSNLDLLEESDCEEEFENIDLSKYVNLEKSYIIECIYNKKFKKWIPINLANNNNIININKINFIIKKNKIFL
jgi:hypothetical protein|uniref:Uncharacterized protein n=1 Tax=viral metagenome TaxID=1070528 RepID=A0A6C0DYN0_9ZZZZ